LYRPEVVWTSCPAQITGSPLASSSVWKGSDQSGPGWPRARGVLPTLGPEEGRSGSRMTGRKVRGGRECGMGRRPRTGVAGVMAEAQVEPGTARAAAGSPGERIGREDRVVHDQRLGLAPEDHVPVPVPHISQAAEIGGTSPRVPGGPLPRLVECGAGLG